MHQNLGQLTAPTRLRWQLKPKGRGAARGQRTKEGKLLIFYAIISMFVKASDSTDYL